MMTINVSYAGESNLEKVTLQLKWLHQFQFAGYYAAIEKRFYQDEGLDVVILERSKNANHIDTVLNGKADYGISDSSLILHRLRGRPVVVLAAIYQHSPLILITRKKDGLIGPLQLKGKRVMMQVGIDGAALTAMFNQLNIRASDMILVEHSLNDDDLINGKVDAISAYQTNQPYYYKQKGLDINTIVPMNYGVDFYGDMLFTSEDEMRRHPDRAMKLLRATLKGWKYALDHKEEIAKLIMAKYAPQKDLDHLMFEANETERMILPNFIEIGHLNINRFHRIAEIYQHEGMAPNTATIDGINYQTYLPGNRSYSKWIKLLLTGLVLGLLCISILLAINWRLRSMVKLRTRDLQDTSDVLKRYVSIVDRYVITSQTDTQAIITYVSEAFCKISKYSRDELIGQHHNIIRHPDTPQETYEKLWGTILNGKVWHGEFKNRAKDGSEYWVEGTIEPLFDHSHKIIGFSSLRRDINAQKKLQELAVRDRLTNLYNRHKLDEALEQEFVRTKRYGHVFSVILLDIDHFKSVNDTFGHQVGDKVLVDTAMMIQNNIRKVDIAGRWGGEEFLVICPDTDLQGAAYIAEKLRVTIESHEHPTVGKKTSSFGVAMYTDGDKVQNLIERADSALYKAKESGRNCVRFLCETIDNKS